MDSKFDLDEHKKIFGKNFKRLRKAAGFKQEKMADLLGYKSQGSVSQIERGLVLMQHEYVIKAAEIFNVHPMVFYSRQEFSDDEIKAILTFFGIMKEKGKYYDTLIDLLNIHKS